MVERIDTIETPTFTKIIKDAIEARLLDLHVALPARVEKYDKAKQKADIQILLKRKYKDGEEISVPVIPNVPVMFNSTNAGKTFITLPLKAGDVGLAIFSERSIDLWLVQGGLITPDDTRKHDYSDAIFIPGLHDFTNVISDASDTDIIIKNETAKIEVQPSGLVRINGTALEVSA